MIDMVAAAFGFFTLTLFWAVTGHWMYLVYRSLWQAGIGLLGLRKPPSLEAAEAAVPSATPDVAALAWLKRHMVSLLGLAGAGVAAMAFFWLLEDLAVDDFSKRCLQLVALLVLTTATISWGILLRTRSPDLLGTGLMLLGFLMLPADAAFYETYILGYSTHSAYKLVLAMSVLAYGLHRKTGSRAFAWIAPQCLMAGFLLVGDHMDWSSTVTSYIAALFAPLLLGLGEWATRGDTASTFLRPVRLSTFLAALVALGAGLGSTPDIFPKLHLIVALLGGGTIAAIGFLELDLRALLLLIPYFSLLAMRQFSEYGTGFGIVGPIAALTGIALLGLERSRRQGRERQRGLDPWCSVPAMMLLLFAFISDCTAGISLLESLKNLGQSVGDMGDPQVLVNIWTESQRAIFYMARVDGILLSTLISGIACALGLAYLGAASGIPVLGLVGGVPLATAAVCGVNYVFPFELHGDHHWMLFVVLVLFFTVRSVVLDRRPTEASPGLLEWYPVRASVASGHRIAAHLLVPVTYLMFGEACFGERVPGWFSTLVIAVIGVQCVIRHVRGAGSPPLRNLGFGLFSFAWPLALFQFSIWQGDSIVQFVALAALGLALLGPSLWWFLTREQWLPAAFAGMGVAGILLALVEKVAIGGMFSKLVVLGFGLGLLWLGARGRKSGQAATMAWMILVISITAPEGAAQAPVTREALAKLGATHPEDPLIRVRLRAAGQVPGSLPTSQRWKGMQDHVAALSGVDSMAAALQISAGPTRIQVLDERRMFGDSSRVRAPQHQPLDYAGFASQLGAGSLPPPGTDRLEWIPGDRITLRFTSPESLRRILAAYESAGKSVLRVTAPQLALPGPDQPFQRGLGATLAELVDGAGAGVISLGDPYLALATDAALVLEMPGEAEASARAQQWESRFGGSRAKAAGRYAVIATEASLTRTMILHLEMPSPGPLSLAEALDFRYTKLLRLPAPDGFVFISEACISRFVSPTFWFMTNRRGDCLADLAELEATLYFGKVTGRPLPPDPTEARREAVVRGWLLDGTLCRDRGLISFEASVPTCSVHGSRLTPLRLDTERTLEIFEEEADAYRDFSARYERLYRQFIDPIAIGVEAQGAHTVLETVILPVARQPYYLTLQNWAGSLDRRLPPMTRPSGSAGALASIAFRAFPHPWNQNTWSGFYWQYYRDPAMKSIRRLMENGGLGQTIGLTLLPGDLTVFKSPREMAHESQPLPLLFYQDVVNPQLARDYLTALFAGSGSGSGGARYFHARLFGRKTLSAGVDDRAVVLGSNREMVEKALAEPGERGELPASLAWMRLQPNALWTAFASMPGFSLDALSGPCLRVMGARQNVIELSPGGSPTPEGVPTGDPFFDPQARCPAGGEYTIGGGGIRCSLHGEPRDPCSAPPAPGSPLEKMLQSLDGLELELAMSPGGIRTRLVVDSVTEAPAAKP